MGTAAIPIVLAFLLVLVAWRVIFSYNRDLVRARAWGELARRAAPFVVLTLMALSIFPIQTLRDQTLVLAWAAGSAILIIIANFISTPALERHANKAFRSGDYAGAASGYRQLAEEKPLARHYAFLSASLGAGERYDEAIAASSKALELDPEYGIALYNRGLVYRRTGKTSKARKDLKRALETDLPRRFKAAVRKILEDL
jgi:tetratricopeptide (TPR) repeat protein